jgi:hypothetical protein
MAVNYFEGQLPALAEENEADRELAKQLAETKISL